jgi:hypothetical protein
MEPLQAASVKHILRPDCAPPYCSPFAHSLLALDALGISLSCGVCLCQAVFTSPHSVKNVCKSRVDNCLFRAVAYSQCGLGCFLDVYSDAYYDTRTSLAPYGVFRPILNIATVTVTVLVCVTVLL